MSCCTRQRRRRRRPHATARADGAYNHGAIPSEPCESKQTSPIGKKVDGGRDIIPLSTTAVTLCNLPSTDPMHTDTGVPSTTLCETLVIGDYIAHRSTILGRGSFGVVVKGTDTSTSETIAIKMIPMPDQQGDSKSGDFESIRREAVIGGSLLHPNIATIYSCAHRRDETGALDTLEGQKQCVNGCLYLCQVCCVQVLWHWQFFGKVDVEGVPSRNVVSAVTCFGFGGSHLVDACLKSVQEFTWHNCSVRLAIWDKLVYVIVSD